MYKVLENVYVKIYIHIHPIKPCNINTMLPPITYVQPFHVLLQTIAGERNRKPKFLIVRITEVNGYNTVRSNGFPTFPIFPAAAAATLVCCTLLLPLLLLLPLRRVTWRGDTLCDDAWIPPPATLPIPRGTGRGAAIPLKKTGLSKTFINRFIKERKKVYQSKYVLCWFIIGNHYIHMCVCRQWLRIECVNFTL